jgi:hypothetical protein
VPERIYIIYHYAEAERERVQRMFLDAGLLDIVVSSELLSGFQRVVVPDEDTVRRVAISAALHELQPPFVRRVLEPNERELRAAPLLHMYVGVHNANDGHPRRGTSYDESDACPECGAGVRQTSPLVLQRREIPNGGLVGGVRGDVLVHESLALEMLDVGLTGVAFQLVHDPCGDELPWRQLVIDHEMPAMTAATRGVIRGRIALEAPCRRCGCDGYFDTSAEPFLPAYDPSVLDDMPDFAWAAERFGTGHWANPIHGRKMLADRRLIVRPSVYAFFRARKVRGVRFTPAVLRAKSTVKR